MNKINYQKELDRFLENIDKTDEKPKLLIHSCCAPCSSYVLEYLSKHLPLTVFYYNPNITEDEEYRKRVKEQQRLINEMKTDYPVDFIEGDYEPEQFFHVAEGLEDVPEGGKRCRECFKLRLAKTAQLAYDRGYDYFTTTLTISPLKNAELLNMVGDECARDYEGLSYLHSDFKKKNGYKRSIELSKEYDLYRQDYCGCVFSKRERERQLAEENKE